MKTLNLEDLNPGTWFDYEENDVVTGDAKDLDPDRVQIKLRCCAGDDFRAIQKATTVEKVEVRNVNGSPRRFPYTKTDEDKQSEMIWDFCIVDWKGFVDPAGKPIPCNMENKKKLMGKSIEFSSFVARKLKALRVIDEEEAELAEKN